MYRFVRLLPVVVLALAGCSSEGSDGDASTETTFEATTAPRPLPRRLHSKEVRTRGTCCTSRIPSASRKALRKRDSQ